MKQHAIIKLQSELNHLFCSYYQKQVVTLQQLKIGEANQLFVLVLEDGTRYVLKAYSYSHWLGIRSSQDISITEKIAHHFAKSLQITESAWLWPNQSIWVPKFESPVILLPWVEGSTADRWDISQSNRLGKMLARMHSNQPKSLFGKMLPKINPSKFEKVDPNFKF